MRSIVFTAFGILVAAASFSGSVPPVQSIGMFIAASVLLTGGAIIDRLSSILREVRKDR
jgi:hypothetical protein